MFLPSCAVLSGDAFAMGQWKGQLQYQGPDMFSTLPNEMKEEIVQYLGYWELFEVSQTNRQNQVFICDAISRASNSGPWPQQLYI